MSIKWATIAAAMLATGVAQAGTPPAAVKPVAAAPADKAETKRYCVIYTSTGSRIPRKLCQTRKDWMLQGFDPLAPKD